jgi:acetoin utilization deacetylase AcuC-like enzyme
MAQRAMGFCLVNNAIVGARHAQSLGRERVLIIDWDVHHGNGTQALMEQDPSIRYISLHQHPWYPGTGMAHERGVGNVFNVPRGPGMPAELYVDDLWAAIVTATTAWEPGLILVSAGFDAMNGDPLGGFTLEPPHYAELTTRLRERLPQAPIVGVLEGGYIPDRIAEGVAAHAGALG